MPRGSRGCLRTWPRVWFLGVRFRVDLGSSISGFRVPWLKYPDGPGAYEKVREPADKGLCQMSIRTLLSIVLFSGISLTP